MLRNPRDVQISSSLLFDVAGDNHVHYGGSWTTSSMLQRQVAEGAFHNSNERFDPPKCHPETRIAVLNKIRGWFQNKDAAAPRIMWLYGPAGAGKSALAQTMAEECDKLRRLVASFFFSRTAPGRNNATCLIATIAYQIVSHIPDTEPHIRKVLEKDPMIFSKSLETQLHQLVTKPLLDALSNNSLPSQFWPTLIIIDGLDECNDRKIQQAIIHCFSSDLIKQVLLLRVLILSRPEQAIRESFSHSDRHGTYISLVLDDNYQPNADIKLFLTDSFNDIRKTHVLKAHIPKTWPSYGDINTLVNKSSGQFIFASTVMQYVKSPRHRPMDRLQHVLGLGSQRGATPFDELDALYMYILQSADEAQHATIMRIFGFIIFKQLGLYQPSDIENFLNLPSGDLYLALVDYHSIIHIAPFSANTHPVSFLHASISDFLLDASRSQRFFVDQGKTHADLARLCMAGKLSSELMVMFYSREAFLHHCQNAYMDKGFIEDLLHFSISILSQYNNIQNNKYWLTPMDQFWLKQFTSIREMIPWEEFNIQKTLLDLYLKTLYQFLFINHTGRLPDIIIALADKIQLIFDIQDTINTWKHAGRLLGLDVPVFKTHNEACTIIHTFPFTSEANFPSDALEIIRNFPFTSEAILPSDAIENFRQDSLHYLRRMGKYYVNQDTYAHLALQCIKYICQETWHPDEYGRCSTLMLDHYNKHHRHDYHKFRECKNCHVPVTCKIGCEVLPSILSSAAPTRELAASLQSGKITNWVKIEVAREEYLKRYDIWEKQQSQPDREAEED